MHASNMGFSGQAIQSNDVSQIEKGPTLVAMATKFEIKSAITWLVYKISRRSLRPTRSFLCLAIE